MQLTCGGSNGGACIETGEQVLENLGFGGHSLLYPMFGQSMIFIGFLFGAFVILSLSKITYMPLGYEGRVFKSYMKSSVATADQLAAEEVEFIPKDTIPHQNIPV